MKQPCHTWIALRAIGLIQDDPKTDNLAKVLLPQAKQASIGAWLPDMPDFKKGHGFVDHHTFKNTLYKGNDKKRFILLQADLLKDLDPNLALYSHISAPDFLPDSWWKQAYKADQHEGEHLPDCLSSLYDTIADMLLLGDPELEALVPGSPGYRKHLADECAISKAQVSTFFFIMSHYVADAFMPCHADKRRLASSTNGRIHKNWEEYWNGRIGPYFEKDKLQKTTDSSQKIIDEAKKLDATLQLVFAKPLEWPDNGKDIWETAILWCRASFAFSCKLFPVDQYPYDGQETPLFSDYFADTNELEEYDRIILQSAVHAVASTWKYIWLKFKA